ncbi:MAG: response regulator [Nitrososphaeraceae archaeon]|nr:response regulator [Nitrososphaeraceae archaeon]MBV9668250.1 response regulator [Nitrososphaeraceae archaeon]
MLPIHTAIIVDDDRDVNLVLAAILKLKKFDVHKVYSAEECLDKLKELEAKVDVICVNGKIAADRAAMLIVKIKRINPEIKICAVAEDETHKTRVLDYGAEQFMTKPIGIETIVDKIMMLLTRKYSKAER